MNYRQFFFCLIAIAVTSLLASVGSTNATLLTPRKISAVSQSKMAWVSEKWTANDKVFLVTKKQIEKKSQASHNVPALAVAYGTLFKKNPKDVLTLYKWGIATFYIAETKPLTWSPADRGALISALESTSSPHSLQYDRMRFLIEARFGAAFYLKKMGLRLLEHSPQDDEVKAAMFPVLNIIGNPSDAQLELTFAEQLIAKHPLVPKWHAMLGSAYVLISIRTNSRLDCERSISAYRDYLKLAKKNDPFYAQAQYRIAAIMRNMPK